MPDQISMLEECLRRIEAGEDPRAVLADYSEHQAELESLVAAAMTVRHRRPRPSSAFRASLQAKLVEAGENHAPARTGQRADGRRRSGAARDGSAEAGGLVGRVAGWLPALPESGSWARRLTFQAVGALTAVMLVLASLGVASADARPGDALYPVRRGLERIGSATEDALRPVLERAGAAMRIEPGPEAVADATETAVVYNVSPRRTATPTPSLGGPNDSMVAADGTTDSGGYEGRSSRGATPRQATARGAATSTSAGGATRQPATLVAQSPTGEPSATQGSGESSVDDADEVPSPTVETRPQQPTSMPPSPVPPTLTEVPPTELPPTPTEPPAPAPAAMAGRVVGPDDEPIEGVEVIAHHEGRGPSAPVARAITDESGAYRIDGLRPGAYKLQARLRGDREPTIWYPRARTREDAEVIRIGPGETRGGLDIRLPRRPGRDRPGP